ncbi:MAG TPA: hypothetical protein VFQ92_06360, partial [Blastocatellia bacterium]|nr:hypothetical protein [Blastocatellia bacterium]
SALVWQPGLLFAGAAVLAFSRYLTSWRDLKAARVMAGAALPLAILLGYLWLADGLRDFYIWTIHFNYAVYAPGGVKTIPEFLAYIARMARGPYRPERVYFALAAVGVAVLLYREIVRARDGGIAALLDEAKSHALIIAPLVYFAFCLMNVQAAGDVFPFLPFVAIFSAYAIVALLDLSERILLRLRPRLDKQFYSRAAFAFVCLVVFVASVADSFSYGGEQYTLQQQEEDVRQIKSHLQPGDKVFVHGATEILVVGGLTNASKYFFLDRGKDVYLDQIEPGGFNGWLERLKAEKPKVVALDRFRWVKYDDAFTEWVDQEYEIKKGRVFTYYLRKE